MQKKPIYTVAIGGQAGQGIKSAGQILAKVATRSGYHIFTYTEFPSIIRGGHNVTQIVIGEEEVSAPRTTVDLLVALNQDTVNRHMDEVVDGGLIIFDQDKRIDTSKVRQGINLCPVPLAKFAIEAGDKELLENTVAGGSVVAMLCGDITVLDALVEEEYGKKGEKVVAANQQAARLGYDFANKEYAHCTQEVLKKKDGPEKKMMISGSEAVGLGAIAGGLQFAAIYPMSPITNILHVLAKNQEKYGFIYKQPEDEISAVNMTIGASYAGARAMTATSGGGFALMSEGYGLAGMTETPIVIIEGNAPRAGNGTAYLERAGGSAVCFACPSGGFPENCFSGRGHRGSVSPDHESTEPG
jgi:2-oxoglutarate/2-oxoacid ferredoxin oxidoreductase subunit alpha